jgi:hypothetical protein
VEGLPAPIGGEMQCSAASAALGQHETLQLAVLAAFAPCSSLHCGANIEAMERYNSTLLDEVTALLKAAPAKRNWLTLPDLIQLAQRGNVALPVDITHLGCLWVLDRCVPPGGAARPATPRRLLPTRPLAGHKTPHASPSHLLMQPSNPVPAPPTAACRPAGATAGG